MAHNIKMTVNGQTRSGTVEARMLLVDFLRDHLGLTGTNIGCDTSQCGSCTIMMDGCAVKSCTALAVQADGSAGVGLLDQNPEPTESEIRHCLEGNICRCTGYQNIVKAVQSASQAMKGGS